MSYWDNFHDMLQSFYVHVGSILESFWDNLRNIVEHVLLFSGALFGYGGIIWETCWSILGSCWDNVHAIPKWFRSILGAFSFIWGRFPMHVAMILKRCWVHFRDVFGSSFGSFCDHFRNILKSCSHNSEAFSIILVSFLGHFWISLCPFWIILRTCWKHVRVILKIIWRVFLDHF